MGGVGSLGAQFCDTSCVALTLIREWEIIGKGNFKNAQP